jgi:hypothetical protein
MKKYVAIALLLTAFYQLQASPSAAQDNMKDNHKDHGQADKMPIPNSPSRKFYFAGDMDGFIFSTAAMQHPGYNNTLGTLRFTNVINIGTTLHYDFSRRMGLFAGLDIKNIGFIEKRADTTVKRRTYTLGIPLGIKFGNMRSRNYFFVGGGCDAPFNYREKRFINRGDKQKFNEWFSDRTPHFMPYVFAGVSMKPGFTIKLQYYLSNYLNTNFTEPSGIPGYSIAPYAGYNVHLIMLTLGVSMPYTKDMVHKEKEMEKGTEI